MANSAPVVVALADLLGSVPQWRDRALCQETDPDAFFPEKGGSTREAKKICFRCEVRLECLEYALGHDERFGIWGGLSERDRRKLKRNGGRGLPPVTFDDDGGGEDDDGGEHPAEDAAPPPPKRRGPTIDHGLRSRPSERRMKGKRPPRDAA